MLWLSAGSVPSRAAGLLATALVARILGAGVYGELTLARSTANTFVTAASFGTGRAAAKLIAEFSATDRTRVGRVVALNYLSTLLSSLVVAVLFFVFAEYLCAEMISAPHLTFQVRLCSPLLIATALAGAQTGALTGFQAYREIAYSATISGFAMIPFYAFGAYYGGLTGATLGFTTGAILTCACNSFFILKLMKARGVRLDFRGCLGELPVLWNFCLPSTLQSLIMSGATWFISVILAQQPDGSGQLGIFDAARQIQTAVLYLPVLAANVVVPALSELNALKARRQFDRTLLGSALLNAGFTGLCALIFSCFPVFIMGAFGKGFEEGAGTLVLLLVTSVVMSVANVYASALTSLGALWSRFACALAWSIAAILGAYAFSPRYPGAAGVALALLLAWILQTAGLVARTRSLAGRTSGDSASRDDR